ncbi:MAG: hypothetical protein B1H12_09585 [Desulfobacteraceae bacterium 4484_190.2]|nr:MAG: hypothetical protein B1H12_09585 [Desulfobacteraceae bacterium 4484_190.2]
MHYQKNILNYRCNLIIFQEKKPPDDLPDDWLTARTWNPAIFLLSEKWGLVAGFKKNYRFIPRLTHFINPFVGP